MRTPEPSLPIGDRIYLIIAGIFLIIGLVGAVVLLSGCGPEQDKEPGPVQTKEIEY